jgi:hypothetical protein
MILHGGLRDWLDEDPMLGRADLVVEQGQEVQADQAVDVVVTEVEHVNMEPRHDNSEYGELTHRKRE